MKLRDGICVALPGGLTWVLIVVSAIVPIESLWGINSAKFVLPVSVISGLGAIGLVTAGLSLVLREPASATYPIRFGIQSIWEYGWRVQLGLALLAGVVYYALRIETYFLGDGYNWISNFSHSGSYVAKFTEPLPTRLIRLLQWMSGEYTSSSALLSFQVLSILSGVVSTFYAIRLIGVLVESPNVRILGLVLWFGSGGMLLFMGYPEFYAPLWAAGIAFLYYAISFMERSTSMWPALILYGLAVSMHLQAVYLSPGMIYLIYVLGQRNKILGGSRRWRRAFLGALTLLSVGVALSFILLYDSIHLYFLPAITGRSNAPDYAMFSPRHILDILNMFFVIVPSMVVLLFLSFRERQLKRADKSVERLLRISLIGSLLFLITIDPALGMARDWDLFSFTVLPLLFYFLHRIGHNKTPLSKTAVVAIALISSFVTGSYVAVNESRGESVKRYHEVLNLYGAKHRGGWTILAEYYDGNGNIEMSKQIRQDMRRTFPDYQTLNRIFDRFGKGDWRGALNPARQLVKSDPNNADFLQALGTTFSRLRRTDSALVCYDKMIQLRPFSVNYRVEKAQILYYSNRFLEARGAIQEALKLEPSSDLAKEYLGRVLLSLNFTDSAMAIADSLLIKDELSATGNLLRLLHYDRTGQIDSARAYFMKYRSVGRNHYEYLSVLRQFKNKY